MNDREAVGIVAGSGIRLDNLLDVTHQTIPFSEFPELPSIGVVGHRGEFQLGQCGDTPVVLQQGRLHMYEGHSYETATRTVDVLAGLDVGRVIFTNAAGGLNPDMEPGHLMAVSRFQAWPFTRWPDAPEELVPDFIVPGCDSEGAYCWVHGPCYETQAEIRALRARQADGVGMSTLPEAVRCRDLDMTCAAVSCITNNCFTPQHLTHEHVMATAQQASERLCSLIREALPDWAYV